MTTSVRFNPAADADFDEAVEWYLANASDFCVPFIEAVQVTLERIKAGPLLFPIVSGTRVRRAIVEKFPYIILFSVRPDHIWVYSVFHTSRNPLIWRGRID